MATGSCLKDKVWQSQQSGHSSLTRELRVAQTLTLAKEHQGHPGSDSPSLSGNCSHIHCRFSWSHFFLSWGFGSYRLVSSIKSNISNYWWLHQLNKGVHSAGVPSRTTKIAAPSAPWWSRRCYWMIIHILGAPFVYWKGRRVMSPCPRIGVSHRCYFGIHCYQVNFRFAVSFLRHHFMLMRLCIYLWLIILYEKIILFFFFPLQPFSENTSMSIMAATSLLGGENGLD